MRRLLSTGAVVVGALFAALQANAEVGRAPLRAETILCQGGAAVPTTGTTSETAQATCTVPANAMGVNGCVVVNNVWSYTNNANNKTVRVRFGGIGGTSYGGATQTTNLGSRNANMMICNRNASNSQVGYNIGVTGAPGTGAIDTTADVAVVFTCQLAVSTDTCTLEYYSVRLARAP